MAQRSPLSSRPLDLLYFLFFLIHIPATLLLDCQALYPESAVPTSIKALPRIYLDVSADPLIAGVFGHAPGDFTWFKMFLYLEAFFQLPIFVLGAVKLWQDSPSIYPLLVIYGASTATTVLPCLTVLLLTPITSPETIAAGIHSVTSFQRILLLSSYIPFLLIPLLIAVDMAFRLSKLVKAGEAVKAKKKNT
ncbi:transmembrane protein 6/97 [Pisolithus marmoratus]|nr:transmembrane protein 6/97 [Pisolithus marmoratus]